MKPFELLALLNGKESEAITRTLTMMAYNPAIGRVLEAGTVDKFSDLMMVTIPKFYDSITKEHFEQIHAETCDQIRSSFKTNRDDTLSYGQSQKAVNVFFKVF